MSGSDKPQGTRDPAAVIRSAIEPWITKGMYPSAVVNDVLAALKDAGFLILPREARKAYREKNDLVRKAAELISTDERIGLIEAVRAERDRCVAIIDSEYGKWASEPNGSLAGASFVRMTLGAIGNMIEEGESADD